MAESQISFYLGGKCKCLIGLEQTSLRVVRGGQIHRVHAFGWEKGCHAEFVIVHVGLWPSINEPPLVFCSSSWLKWRQNEPHRKSKMFFIQMGVCGI